MPKRKQDDQETSGSEDELDIVNVDFEFFDPNPDVDYIALKRLLQQLFHSDATLFPLGDLADLILSQPLVGTTVKTDGKESDPFAFLTVLNLHIHKAHPAIGPLIEYLVKKISPNQIFSKSLSDLLADNTKQVGLIIGERVFNMPPQVIPPMYRMLRDEIQWAIEDNEPYSFTHFLVLSRVWHWTAEESVEALYEAENAQPPKRRKSVKSQQAQGPTTHSYHPEDVCIQKVASFTVDFEFSNREPRHPDSFGTDVGGRVMLLGSANLDKIVHSMEDMFPAISAGMRPTENMEY